MPNTAHLNNVCKDHENGRCLKIGHVYLCVEHAFRHLASYMKIKQVWIAHFQTSMVMLVIIFAYMQKHAKSGCGQQELIQHGCPRRGGQDFLHHQVSNAGSNNSRGVERKMWGCTCVGICHAANMEWRLLAFEERDTEMQGEGGSGRERKRIALKIRFKVGKL